MKKYLFVGGKADGHMIDVIGGYNHWTVPYIQPFNQFPIFEEEELNKFSTSCVENETYRKIQWIGDKNDKLEFFVLDSMNNHDIMRIMLSNYKPKQDVENNILIKSMKNLLEECVSLMNESMNHMVTRSIFHKINKTTIKVFKFLNIHKL
jgi:hypothetical protein